MFVVCVESHIRRNSTFNEMKKIKNASKISRCQIVNIIKSRILYRYMRSNVITVMCLQVRVLDIMEIYDNISFLNGMV